MAAEVLPLLPPGAEITPALEPLPTVIPFVDRVPAGRLVEVSGTGAVARTTTALSVVRACQREGETTAWIQPRPGWLYPPDLEHVGIDLDSLVVVHIPQAPPPAPHAPLLKAAELLLRSGAFGLLVLDLRLGDVSMSRLRSSGWAGRLLGLARQHESRVLILTEKPEAADSLGPLVGIRIEPRRQRCSKGAFAVSVHVLKNKSGDPTLEANTIDTVHRGPWGLV